MRQIGKAHLLGGGVGTLSAAVYMIRDGHVNPHNITIYEALPVDGGSCDGAGEAATGYMIRGGRMLNFPAYECLWDLMKFIPSVDHENQTLWDETWQFNQENKTEGHARLVDHNRKRVDVTGMGFTMKHRMDFLKLLNVPEDDLKDMRICDFFDADFFHTNFWYMWSTTFAFQTWHSCAELKRYCIRFQHEFLRIHTLEGVARTVYNQYDSIIYPIEKWLKDQGVNFQYNTYCYDIALKAEGEQKTVTSFKVMENKQEKQINVGKDDLVFMTNGSMTDAASLGTMDQPVKVLGKKEATSWILWEKLAEQVKDGSFGNPSVFTRCINESLWYSFTVTINDNPKFFQQEIAFSQNEPGTGALVSFKDSNWLMSIVVPKQPHFRNQPKNCQVFWGYALFPNRVGDFVNKPMLECTGAEILEELIGHLGFDHDVLEGAICRTCCMPYITAQFMTRVRSDRPLPVPKGCTNLGLTSQFVEIPDDVVFTVEYSVRSAQMAVYQLMNIKDKKVPPVSHHEKELGTKIKCVKKAFQSSPISAGFKAALNIGIGAGLICLGIKAVKYYLARKGLH